MKLIACLTILLSFQVHAAPSRSPAVDPVVEIPFEKLDFFHDAKKVAKMHRIVMPLHPPTARVGAISGKSSSPTNLSLSPLSHAFYFLTLLIMILTPLIYFKWKENQMGEDRRDPSRKNVLPLNEKRGAANATAEKASDSEKKAS